jgi:WD40 repeat protein
MGTTDETYRYDAFISYRHVEPDRRWAKWLHTALETYRVPKQLVQQRGVPARIERVFRDEEELPASADLNQEIETALRESRFLIVVCSPRAVQSLWVNKEVLRFREMGRHDRILALLIEGGPGESFPPALREIRRTITDSAGMEREEIEEVEPLAADVRPSRHEARGHLGRMAKLRLLACVLGCRFDDLRQREQERRTRRMAYLSAAGSLLVVAMAGLATFAFVQRRAALAYAYRAVIGERRASENERRALEGESLAKANAQRAETSARLATSRESEARASERSAKLELAERLVSEADGLHRSGRILEAREQYWESLDRFQQASALPFPAEVALCIAYSESAPPLLTLAGHTGSVSSVALSRDGRTALSGSIDKTIKLWDLRTGIEIRTLRGHTGWVTSVALAADGNIAVSGSWDTTLKVWNLQTGEEVRTLRGHAKLVHSVAISPDGSTALSGSEDNTVKLWDLRTGTEIRTLNVVPPVYHHEENNFMDPNTVSRIAYSPDGHSALVGGGDGGLTLWDLSNGKQIRMLESHTDRVNGVAVAFSPDGRTALSGRNKTVTLWDLESGKIIRSFEPFVAIASAAKADASTATTIAMSPDGRTALAGGYDNRLKLCDLLTGKVIRTFEGRVGDVTYSPDGRLALSSSDNSLKLWSLRNDREIRTFQGHSDAVQRVAFSPDGRTVMSGSWDTTLKLWDVATAKIIRTFKGHAKIVMRVTFALDGRTALSNSLDKTLKFWDLRTGEEIRSMRQNADNDGIIGVAPDSRTALYRSGSMENSTIKVWDLATNTGIRTLEYRGAWEDCAAFSADGRIALCGGQEPSLRLFDLQTGKQIRTLSGNGNMVYDVALSSDGRLALSGGGDNVLKLSDVRTGKEIRTLQGHMSHVYSVAISPNGRTALSGGHDNTLKLWNLETCKEIHTLEGHSAPVQSVAFSPDGAAALSGSSDRTLKLWNFSRIATYHESDQRISQAQSALQGSPNDPQSLNTLGNWYAFRGKNDWAVELLERARAGGAAVDPLTLARCYWELSGDIPPRSGFTRDASLAGARREYAAALAAAKDPNDTFYLQLCLGAIEREAGTAATGLATEATTHPSP